MRGRTLSGLMAILIVTAWMGVICGDAVAQGQGRSKSKDKKKTEQKDKAEKKAGEAGEKAKGEVDEVQKKADKAQKKAEKQHAKAEKKTYKYKPKNVSAKELEHWVDGTPPGWSKGKKAGWDGAGAPPGQLKKEGAGMAIYPPAAEGWDERKKEDWDRRLERSKDRVRETMKKRGGMTKNDEDSAIISIDRASRRGVPIKTVEETVDHAVKRGMGGADIEKVTRAMAYGADKDVDHDRIGKFARQEMDRGKTGDELALSVYQEIDARQEAPKQKRPWWKRMFGG